jgi:hypothetical protein
MSALAKEIADKRVLKVMRAFLNAGVMENGVVSVSEQGVSQGGPLSPLSLTANRSKSFEKRLAELSMYLSGWSGYFGHCETPNVLKDLDTWTGVDCEVNYGSNGRLTGGAEPI